MLTLGVLLILAGLAALAWLASQFVDAPTIPDPAKQVAAAALTPDAPLFTDAEQAAIAEIAGVMAGDDVTDEDLAAEVDALLADLFPTIRPAVPTEES